MSPFASTFHKFRLSRGIAQKAIADQAGYEQSYVSAMENGLKGPPSQEFLQKISRVLQLTPDEQRALFDAAQQSQRRFALPAGAPESTYILANEFWRCLETIHPVQVEIIRATLKIPVDSSVHP